MKLNNVNGSMWYTGAVNTENRPNQSSFMKTFTVEEVIKKIEAEVSNNKCKKENLLDIFKRENPSTWHLKKYKMIGHSEFLTIEEILNKSAKKV